MFNRLDCKNIFFDLKEKIIPTLVSQQRKENDGRFINYNGILKRTPRDKFLKRNMLLHYFLFKCHVRGLLLQHVRYSGRI